MSTAGGQVPLIKLENIEKWYGTVHALRGVSMEVFPGEIVGFIGDNGAGKSTLIKIISGVLPHNAGGIFWKGEEVSIPDVKAARKLGIETVYQDRAVIGTMTVAENIFLGREPVKKFLFINRLDKSRMRVEALRLCKDLKLDIPSSDQEVRFCSGGEMQGVAISRAMHFRAALVILDEPTTALAVSGVQRVLHFIRRLKEEGIACIFVTHNLYDVHAVADRFVVMRRGEVVANCLKEQVSVEDLINLQLTDQPND
jgi:ABC-type sugar transport system ATPase subunit